MDQRTSSRGISRRELVAALALSAPSALAACTTSRRRARDSMLVYVGTYTTGGRQEGVYVLRMDARTGALQRVGSADVGRNPSFLALHPNGRFLYAVNEVTRYEGRPDGAVVALALDPATGLPSVLNRRSSVGGAPCYVSVGAAGRHLLVANYVGGSVAVLPIGADGTLGASTSAVRHRGSGPNTRRQEGPHAHCIIPDPSGRFVLAADLGIDTVMVYRLDERGVLSADGTRSAALAPGAGPRHLAFHPNGRFLYVVNELDLTLARLRWDGATGALSVGGTVPLLAAPPAGEATAADLHVAPTGRTLYASVRGVDALVVFDVDPTTGEATRRQQVPTGGSWPRSFALAPGGRFLYVANQRSDSIVVFAVDARTGALAPTGARVDVPSPVYLRFAG